MINRLESTFYLEVDFKKQTKAKDYSIRQIFAETEDKQASD